MDENMYEEIKKESKKKEKNQKGKHTRWKLNWKDGELKKK